MILNCVLLIVGIAIVLYGADKFTDGACGIARKWHVSEMVIGLTIVALGTSLPEFMVSFFSVLRGSSDMSVGNIVGSNIFNTLVIVGASALMMKINVDKALLVLDIPISIFVSLMLFVTIFWDGTLSRYDGSILLIFFLCYMGYTFYLAKKGNENQDDGESAEQQSVIKLLVLIVFGGACLVGGGQLLVNNAAELARQWGVSESVIGLTILAGGTSLPELATSMVAAKKGSYGLALGNAIGSNVFNIAFVLGTCSLILPMQVNDICNADWITLIMSNVLLWIVAFTGKKLCKIEGAILLACYLAYLVYLLS